MAYIFENLTELVDNMYKNECGVYTIMTRYNHVALYISFCQILPDERKRNENAKIAKCWLRIISQNDPHEIVETYINRIGFISDISSFFCLTNFNEPHKARPSEIEPENHGFGDHAPTIGTNVLWTEWTTKIR